MTRSGSQSIADPDARSAVRITRATIGFCDFASTTRASWALSRSTKASTSTPGRNTPVGSRPTMFKRMPLVPSPFRSGRQALAAVSTPSAGGCTGLGAVA